MANLKNLVRILILITPYVITANDSCCFTTPSSQNLWQPHAFSAYSSTNLIQIKDAYTQASQGNISKDHLMYLTFFSEYKQSFGCKTLGSLPFWGATGDNSMTIGTNDGLSDIDAYQFGMGTVTTPGLITLNPRVQHFGIDTQWYYMQHTSGRGIVAKIDAPFGAMRITTTLKESPAKLSNSADLEWTPPYPAVASRPQTLSTAFQGGSVANNSLQSQVHHPITLHKGRIAGCCSHTQIRLADLAFTLGYNCINDDRGLFMFGAKVTCPTGNVPNGDYALEPIFGRAGHWGIGGEITASYRAWQNDTSQLRLWAQGELLHLTSGRKPSFRSFDLALNGKGSKYLLLQYYAAENPDLTATPSNPTGRFGSFITQAVNLTTFPVISNIGVEGSLAFMLDYTKDRWNLGFGGQVWGRSQESLSIDYCNAIRYGMVNLNDYAVLGRQISLNNATNVALTYCEPLATINKSVARQTTSTNAFPNQVKDARLATNRIPADLTVALDICGAQAPRAINGQIFGEFGYTWNDHIHTPNISLFGSAEFTNTNSAMVNMWSVGVKVSLTFGDTKNNTTQQAHNIYNAQANSAPTLQPQIMHFESESKMIENPTIELIANENKESEYPINPDEINDILFNEENDLDETAAMSELMQEPEDINLLESEMQVSPQDQTIQIIIPEVQTVNFQNDLDTEDDEISEMEKTQNKLLTLAIEPTLSKTQDVDPDEDDSNNDLLTEKDEQTIAEIQDTDAQDDTDTDLNI